MSIVDHRLFAISLEASAQVVQCFVFATVGWLVLRVPIAVLVIEVAMF